MTIKWPIDNLDSWREIQPFIAHFPDKNWYEWKRVAKKIIDSIGSDDIKGAFRIGMSMSHIIFSTLDHHELADEPRVTLEIHPDESDVRIAYGTSNLWFLEDTKEGTVTVTVEEKTVPVANAPDEIRVFLKKLWHATKHDEPLPITLQ